MKITIDKSTHFLTVGATLEAIKNSTDKEFDISNCVLNQNQLHAILETLAAKNPAPKLIGKNCKNENNEALSEVILQTEYNKIKQVQREQALLDYLSNWGNPKFIDQARPFDNYSKNKTQTIKDNNGKLQTKQIYPGKIMEYGLAAENFSVANFEKSQFLNLEEKFIVDIEKECKSVIKEIDNVLEKLEKSPHSKVFSKEDKMKIRDDYVHHANGVNKLAKFRGDAAYVSEITRAISRTYIYHEDHKRREELNTFIKTEVALVLMGIAGQGKKSQLYCEAYNNLAKPPAPSMQQLREMAAKGENWQKALGLSNKILLNDIRSQDPKNYNRMHLIFAIGNMASDFKKVERRNFFGITNPFSNTEDNLKKLAQDASKLNIQDLLTLIQNKFDKWKKDNPDKIGELISKTSDHHAARMYAILLKTAHDKGVINLTSSNYPELFSNSFAGTVTRKPYKELAEALDNLVSTSEPILVNQQKPTSANSLIESINAIPVDNPFKRMLLSTAQEFETKPAALTQIIIGEMENDRMKSGGQITDYARHLNKLLPKEDQREEYSFPQESQPTPSKLNP